MAGGRRHEWQDGRILSGDDERWLRDELNRHGLKWREAKADDDELIQAWVDGAMDMIVRTLLAIGSIEDDGQAAELIALAKGTEDDF